MKKGAKRKEKLSLEASEEKGYKKLFCCNLLTLNFQINLLERR